MRAHHLKRYVSRGWLVRHVHRVHGLPFLPFRAQGLTLGDLTKLHEDLHATQLPLDDGAEVQQ